MRHLAISLALVCACADAPNKSTPGQPDEPLVAGTVSTGGGGDAGTWKPPACPLGAPTFTTELGASNPLQQLSLAAEPNGNVLVGAATPSSTTGASGAMELSPSGAVLLSLPIGSLVASDAAGNKYIAGPLTTPIKIDEFGRRVVLTPTDNNDVFILKLDPHDRVLLAKVLDLCGAGLVALGVEADGHIAVSGTEFGTAVLSRHGDVEQLFPEVGQVAFDSTGDLLIAGSQTPTAFAFLERRDPAGTLVFRTSFEGKGTQFTSLVIDSKDNIVFAGFTTAFVDIFGLDITAKFAPESGRVTGAFVARVKPNFDRLLVLDLGIVEANAVAVDTLMRIFVGGAATVNTGFFRAPVIIVVDAAGKPSPFDFGLAGGRVLALAVDSCGSVLAGLVRQPLPDPTSPIDAVVQKLAL